MSIYPLTRKPKKFILTPYMTLKHKHSGLEKVVGVKFKKPKLIEAALSHPSYRNEMPVETDLACFQRLEFLGDAVLNYFIARKLYELFPDANEGQMSRLRSTLVSRKILARVAKTIRLRKFLKLGRIDQNGFAFPEEKILADSLEALIAAIYFDRGLKTTDKFLARYFSPYLNEKKLLRLDPNPKSTLQEMVQKDYHILPTYHPGIKRGDFFIASVSVRGKLKTNGRGRTLREAEADAAGKLIQKLKLRKRKLSV